MKKRDIILFASIFCVLSLIVGSTYAYWVWRSAENKSVVFNTSKSIQEYITYDEGDSHFVGDFQPSANYCGGASNVITFSKSSEASDVTLVATINMDVNHTINSSAVKWALTMDTDFASSSSCNNVLPIASGDFSGVSSDQTLQLKTDIEVAEELQAYKIWLWVDSDDSNASALSGKTIDVNIWTQIDMLPSDACVIHYNNDSSERWIQRITEGQSFTLPSTYESYILDGDNSVCLYSGTTVTYPCGTSFTATQDFC